MIDVDKTNMLHDMAVFACLEFKLTILGNWALQQFKDHGLERGLSG